MTNPQRLAPSPSQSSSSTVRPSPMTSLRSNLASIARNTQDFLLRRRRQTPSPPTPPEDFNVPVPAFSPCELPTPPPMCRSRPNDVRPELSKDEVAKLAPWYMAQHLQPPPPSNSVNIVPHRIGDDWAAQKLDQLLDEQLEYWFYTHVPPKGLPVPPRIAWGFTDPVKDAFWALLDDTARSQRVVALMGYVRALAPREHIVVAAPCPALQRAVPGLKRAIPAALLPVV